MMLENGILSYLLDYTLVNVFHGNKNKFARALDFDRHYVRTVINKVRNGENSDKLRENLLDFYFADETHSLDKIRADYLESIRSPSSSCESSDSHFEQYIDYFEVKIANAQAYKDVYLDLSRHVERLKEEYCVAEHGKSLGVGCDACQFTLIHQTCPLKVVSDYANWLIDCHKAFDGID